MLLRHIRYFLAVAEHRNFTRAAEALHVSQPTLSQQIRQLEDTLRVQLLDRSGRTIQLTDAGAAYVRYAQRALQDLEAGKRAIHDVQELSRGSLRLAMTPTFTAYLIGPLLEKYNRRYPNITLNILEMPQDRMEALLNEDALDVGIAFNDTHSPDIETQVLFVEALGDGGRQVASVCEEARRVDVSRVRERSARPAQRSVCHPPLHRSILQTARCRSAHCDGGQFDQRGHRDRAAQRARNAATCRDRARAQRTVSGGPGAGAAAANRCVATAQRCISKCGSTGIHRACA